MIFGSSKPPTRFRLRRTTNPKPRPSSVSLFGRSKPPLLRTENRGKSTEKKERRRKSEGIGMADGRHDELEDLGGLTTSIGQLNIENTSVPSTSRDQNDLEDDGTDDFWLEDDFSNDILDDGSSHASVLNREGRFRHNKNHIMGYREGITAGNEASAQEGFNVGFRQSVDVGYRWGHVRGITSALAGLSDSSKEKLVNKFENIDRFQNLDKSVQAISANDALKMYYNSILPNESMQSHDHSEGDLQAASLTDEDSSSNILENLYNDLISLLHDTPEINVTAIKTSVG